MRILALLIGVAALTGCASTAYQQRRTMAVDSLQAKWGACIDSAALQWLDERDESAPEEIKQSRIKLTIGQMLVRSMDQCRAFLRNNVTDEWEQLDDSELRRYIRDAEKRFFRIRNDISMQRTLEQI